jgi:DNA-binding SARP family transcriptional activator
VTNQRSQTAAKQLRLATAAPCVADPDGTALALSPLDAALLALLALEGPTPRTRLVALLWPDSEHVAARNVLRQRLFQLRRALGFDVVVGNATLALAEGVTHDLEDADSVLGQAAPAAGGEFAAWLEQQRQRRRDRVQQALADLAQAAEDAQDWNEALSHAHELLALQPTSEAAHRRLIRLHYLLGDRAAALLAFDHCERVLKDEVGARPSRETLALLATLEQAGDVAPSAPTLQRVPASVLRPPRAIGRDAELQSLADAVDRAAVVLLLGEAGMGKSRLIADWRAAAAAATSPSSAQVVAVSARPGDAAVPYALATRWLRAVLLLPGFTIDRAQRDDLARLLPELGPAKARTDADERMRLRRVVPMLLEQAVERGLRAVIVDDLHYADSLSITLLGPLIGGTGCAWIIAMRPGELSAEARALVQAHAGSAKALTLELQALDTAAVGVLLDSLAIHGIGGMSQADSLRRHTGGNPLFLLETLKLTLSAPSTPESVVPNVHGVTLSARDAPVIAWPRADTVQRLIQQRLLRLAPLALKLARCAALAGQDFSPALAAQVLGMRPLDLADAWAELEAAQVLQHDGFAHDLIAEAALALVPQPIAQVLRAQIAGFLEQGGGEPVRIAAHWLAAGEPTKAVPHLTRSAQRAQAAWQRGVAAELHEQVATILRVAGDRRGAFDAYFAAAEAASQMVGRGRLAFYGEALKELADDDDGQRAAAALVPTFLLHESRQIQAARRLALAALPQAQRAGAADIEVELLWFLALFHHDLRELNEAMQRIEQALARLAAVDPATARLKHLGTRLKLTSALGMILSSTGQYVQGNVHLTQAMQQARDDREWAYTSGIATDLANNSLEQGHLEAALAWSARSIADDDRYDGGEHFRAVAAGHRAVVLALGGNLGGALASVERAVAICEQVSLRVELQVRQRLHALQFELGRRDLALKGLRALRARDDLQAHERIRLDAELLRIGVSFNSTAILEQVVALDDFPLRCRILCLAQPGCDPVHILPLLAWSAATARDHGAHGLWLTLQTRRVTALRMAGRTTEAQEQALAVWQRAEAGITGIEIFPRMAADLCAALADTHADLMQIIALRAGAWMQRAAASLPAVWRQNYLMRSPTLQALPPQARGLLMMAGQATEASSAGLPPQAGNEGSAL